jgi:hypothetical protein
MAQEIGESREAWGQDVWKMAEEFASKMKSEVKPFYIVYACKEDKPLSVKFGKTVFRQIIRAYFKRPPKMLGILVWYVDHSRSEFRFVPELSAPMDVPLDPSLLSDKASDASPSMAARARDFNVLVS